MKRKFIPVGESFAQWKKEPKFAAAYALLEGEFSDLEEGLREGMKDVAEGRTRPAREVFEELRANHRIAR